MKVFLIILNLVFSVALFAVNPNYTIFLYPDGNKPNDNGYVAADEEEKNKRLYKTSEPRMDIYLPKEKANAIILACPGGGYVFTSIPNEGEAVANYFTPRNIAVAVLKYRMPNQKQDVPLSDAVKAMKILRDSAQIWGVPTNHIGVIGFSAGGHLAATLVTKYYDQKSRPDFGILVYPVISMDSTITHKGSCKQLLGENPSEKQRIQWSAEKCVNADTPPCFIVHCQDDKTVMVENSIRMYQALTSYGIKAEMLLLPTGAHGWGFSKQIPQKELFEAAMNLFINQQMR